LQGSIARQVLADPKNLSSRDGRPLKLRMSVLAISFSAHADFRQTSEFIDIIKVPKVILVHGEKREINKLSKEISYLANSRGVERYVYSPDTGQSIQIYQKAEKTINVVGLLARKNASEGLPLNGLVVQKEIEDILIDPHDLKNYTKLQPCKIKHRLTLPMKHNYNSSNILSMLASDFENILINKKNKTIESKIQIANKVYYGKITFTKITVEGIVCVTMLSVQIPSGKLKNREYLILEWETNIVTDMYAHDIIVIIIQEKLKPEKMNNREKIRPDKVYFLAKIDIILDILRVQISPIWCFNHQKRTTSSRIDGTSIQINHRDLARYMNVFCPEDLCLETRVNLKIKVATIVPTI
jgi:cleavage and polyadenylation specificity factor subunit 3